MYTDSYIETLKEDEDRKVPMEYLLYLSILLFLYRHQSTTLQYVRSECLLVIKREPV